MTNAIRNAGVSNTMTETKLTGKLLACGVIAGPFYLIVGLLQAFTRPGFDITRHSLSLLSNGELGWIHVTNLVVTGLLTIAGAVGIGRALRTGIGHSLGPLLIGFYGLSLIGAGVFIADPALGFPPGTPADANNVSWHGLLHLAVGGSCQRIVGRLPLNRRITLWVTRSATPSECI